MIKNVCSLELFSWTSGRHTGGGGIYSSLTICRKTYERLFFLLGPAEDIGGGGIFFLAICSADVGPASWKYYSGMQPPSCVTSS